jgi:type IV pilus assembly protein PilM
MDFGDWALKVARGSYDKKTETITIDLFEEIVYGTLPCGYEAGPLEKQREGIAAFRRRYEIGAGEDLCVSVPGSEVFSRFINLPPVPESIDEIIRYEARQQIPFDIDDVVWDYQQVKEEVEEGEEIEVGLFALKKERVEELMDLLDPWRGNLRVVQDAPLAVYNLLDYEGVVEQEAIVLDVGSATTDVLVLNPPRFWVRTLLVAGDDLTNALVDQFGIALEEAEKIKRQAGRSAHRDQILRILQPVFDDLVNEVQRSLGYYKSLARDVRFENVLALGNALRMTGLPQMLAAGLQYQVQSALELNRLELAEAVDQERFQTSLPGLCAALGLVVQGAGQGRVRINMVPEQVALASAINAKKPWLLASAAGLLVAAGVLVAGEKIHAQEFAVTQRVNWAPMEDAAKLEKDYNAVAGEVRRLESQLRSMAEAGVDRGFLLRLLPVYADAMPENVYTLNLDFKWATPASADSVGEQLASDLGRSGVRAFSGARGDAAAISAAAASRARAAAMGFAPSMPIDGRGGSRRGAARRSERAAPKTGEGTVLVMRFSCETSEISKEYIETAVFGALRKAKFPEQMRPAFQKVVMVGDVQDVYRDDATGETAMAPQPGYKRYVAFGGYAVVNLGEEAAEAD